MGEILPVGSITVATMVRRIPPLVGSLGEVEEMIAGIKQAIKSASTATELDFSDNGQVFGLWIMYCQVGPPAFGAWSLRAS